MKRSLTALALLGVAAVALAPATASAQNQTDQDVINANAVVAAAIAVTGQQDLDFGTVMPNFFRTVAVDDPTAGHFLVTGTGGAEVSLSLNLPTDLSDGTNNLPVTFTALHNTVADPTSGTTFDPTVGEPGTTLGGAGELHVYMGGTVTAASSQVAGSYTAQVQLTAAYTGN